MTDSLDAPPDWERESWVPPSETVQFVNRSLDDVDLVAYLEPAQDDPATYRLLFATLTTDASRVRHDYTVTTVEKHDRATRVLEDFLYYIEDVIAEREHATRVFTDSTRTSRVVDDFETSGVLSMLQGLFGR